MIEKYGKFTALDGTEFPYTDFAQVARRRQPRPRRTTGGFSPCGKSKRASR